MSCLLYTSEEVTSDIPETVPDDLADLSSLTDGMDDTDKTPDVYKRQEE